MPSHWVLRFAPSLGAKKITQRPNQEDWREPPGEIAVEKGGFLSWNLGGAGIENQKNLAAQTTHSRRNDTTAHRWHGVIDNHGVWRISRKLAQDRVGMAGRLNENPAPSNSAR